MKDKIQFFSEKTKKLYQLVSTRTIPALKISGVPMHRHINIDPLQDTRLKIKGARPFGRVLDICTGLGYTAIYSARLKEVKEVISIEKDENVLKLARMNESSKELFYNGKIEIKMGNAFDLVNEFDNEFDCIINDPPTFKMAPELYSVDFYQKLYKILKKNGRLWHYAPEVGKLKGRDKDFIKKIMLNLSNSGFNVLKHESNGIIAKKKL